MCNLWGCVMTTKEWMLKIAEAVEAWPAMRQDNVEVWMAVSTPAGAVTYVVNNHIPTEERAQVSARLPTLTTDDFGAAARQLRDAAEALD